MSADGSGDFEGMGDEFRKLALAAGVSAEILDGPSRCFAGCGTIVARGSDTCPVCAAARQLASHTEAIKRAWSSVPGKLRWATLGSLDLPKWVRDPEAIQKAREWATQREQSPSVVLTGPPGAGKTTLACAMMHRWMMPGAAKGAPAGARIRSAKARFFAAHRLIADRAETRLGEHVVSIDLARQASLLVLDEVGRGVDTHGVVFSILHERHAEGRPTIMTTPLASAAELAAITDGGLARRVFDDSLVIHVRKDAA